MRFADQLKQERERLGITQAQAASLLNVSKSVIEKWEAGTNQSRPPDSLPNRRPENKCRIV